jgi:hypothetical protein
MNNFTNDRKKFTARPGLYRVWVPLHNDGKAPLISIWIDPTMTAFERQQSHEGIRPSGVRDGEVAEEIEDSRRWGLYCSGSGCQSGDEFSRRYRLTGSCAA